MNNFLRARKA